MNILQKNLLILGLLCSGQSFAAEFSFDRPGTGFGTGITPVGKLAWEQSLPTANYTENKIDGAKQRTVTLNSDMLLRTGLNESTELRLGWQGPHWRKSSYRGQHQEDSGSGDMSVGIKKAIDLQDDKLSMALLAEVQFATGNDEFTEHDDQYTVGSSLNYQYDDNITTSISMLYAVQHGDWSVTAVPTIGYKLTNKLSGYSEFVYRKKESVKYDYRLASGLIYNITDRAQVDASVGVDLGSTDRNNYSAGLGFAYLF
ncbi:transporter [Acinetobacter rudis]|uniref:transporter n=1 Tax=Acinetobacter rudis TaxID=632955 RepID=UPI00280E10FE|nr:transporter [Acinetobacter rudis]MDQ8952501.1 transporter [Acinetobacter rudis]